MSIYIDILEVGWYILYVITNYVLPFFFEKSETSKKLKQMHKKKFIGGYDTLIPPHEHAPAYTRISINHCKT